MQMILMYNNDINGYNIECIILPVASLTVAFIVLSVRLIGNIMN